jgi:hypothetical protein
MDMFIDSKTSHLDLIDAITASLDGIQFCIDHGVEPQTFDTETLRKLVLDFIKAGDECASA